ncbi:MAG: hypothetical protein ACI9C1_001451 [Candidatus Aldehydirespiratoraceae bacterium]|jgi:hypothetical protein
MAIAGTAVVVIALGIEADQDVAEDAGQALARWLESGPTSSNVRDWETIEVAVLAASDHPPFSLDGFRVDVDGPPVHRLTDVCISYRVFNGDSLLFEAQGAVFLIGEGWIVSRDTACALIAVTGIECPAAQPTPYPRIKNGEFPPVLAKASDPRCGQDQILPAPVPAATVEAEAAFDGWLNTIPREEGAGKCPALHGVEPWLILFEPEPYWTCRRVAEFQQLHVWNKGSAPLQTVEWPSGTLDLQSDTFVVADPAGELFAPGQNEIEGSPHSVPTIWLVPRDESAVSEWALVDGSFETMTIGMTLREANIALQAIRGPIGGVPIPTVVVDPNLVPGPTQWAAVFEGDPHSPTILVEGSGDGSSVITEIIPADEW